VQIADPFSPLGLLYVCVRIVRAAWKRSSSGLEMDDIQTRHGHWAIVDFIGKDGHVRIVPIPFWAKQGRY
jgi:hypothetical protein